MSYIFKQGCPEVAKIGGGRFFGNFLKTFMKNCWKNYENFRKILGKLSRFSKNSWNFWKFFENSWKFLEIFEKFLKNYRDFRKILGNFLKSLSKKNRIFDYWVGVTPPTPPRSGHPWSYTSLKRLTIFECIQTQSRSSKSLLVSFI
jgi:hypothetical protein